MKYIDAERLRKEVKGFEKTAHKSALGCTDSETRKFYEGKGFAYQFVGALIDSLQQEQQERDLEKEYLEKEYLEKEYLEKEYLEKEYKDYVENDPVYSKLVNGIAGRGIARHFAEWQKSQMLKDAIEWEVIANIANRPVIFLYQLHGFKPGDKVKVIVLKEEE